MAYTAPDTWSHGDRPTAAKVNKWKTDLDEIHGTAGDRAINLPCGVDDAATRIYFIHRFRYLHFLADAGVITDPAGIGETVAIASDGGFNVYDLDNVSWLTYGALYYVDECNTAIEYWQA